MKKFAILALAALLVVAFTVPASALENIFGGYWRTRMYQQKNFDGDNTGAADLRQVDTRTRLYYTAKLNDNLKLVNKFEFDTVWGNTLTSPYASNTGTATAPVVGGTAGYSPNWGDIGTDGVAIEIKNSYADFNVGPVNFLVGAQTFTLARGFLSNEDAVGMKAVWKVNDGLYLPFVWQKVAEGGAGRDQNENDVDAYIFTPIIMLSKDIKINPYYVFYHAEDGQLFMQVPGAASTLNANKLNGALGGQALADNINVNVLGLDFDAKMGAASLWFTGIMQFGDVTLTPMGAATFNTLAGTHTVNKKTLVAGDSVDLAAYLVAAGGKFDLGKADIHGQAFYATGEDKYGYTDGEWNGFFTSASTVYYWSEILGGGLFDNAFPSVQGGTLASPNPAVTNIMAANLGVTVKPMDKLSISADLWWAKLAEENADNEDELGIEANLKITYKLIDGLDLDIVGAYLFAGDAMEAGTNGKNERDPYEFGTQLSLSF